MSRPPLPTPLRLSLTGEEVRFGYRRAADVPRLKYLARALDGRESDRITIPVIKRALALAEEDGVALDPLTGFVLADQSGAPAPKRKKKGRKKKAAKAPETPQEPSEPAPDADATDDAPSPDAQEDAQESPTEG